MSSRADISSDRRAVKGGRAVGRLHILAQAPSLRKVESGSLLFNPLMTSVLSMFQTRVIVRSPRGLTAMKVRGPDCSVANTKKRENKTTKKSGTRLGQGECQAPLVTYWASGRLRELPC